MGRALQEQLGIVHVEVDRHHVERSDAFEERQIERAEWIAAYRKSYHEVENALRAGKSVVFDAVSYRRTQRDRIRRIGDNHGVLMTIIQMNVSADLARARLNANRANPVRPTVPDADFEEVSSGMQPPMDDARSINYNPDEDIAEWIQREIAPMLKSKRSL